MKHRHSSAVDSLKHGLRHLRSRTSASWRTAVLYLVLLIGLLGAGGFMFAWFGLAPIAASSGHWPITRWFLHFTMRNGVETRALGTDLPPLNGAPLSNAAMVLKGAGHYATGCAPCHGAPGEPQSLIAKQMTPQPPFLPPKIHEWTTAQLFWIVKYGIKYTAMPAWVALQRDDEVWAVVKFLQQMPELSPAHYRALAYGPEASADAATSGSPARLRSLSQPLNSVLEDCGRCHGTDGTGRETGAFPKLAGQSQDYLAASLRAFASGDRHSGIMQPIAAGLADETLHALAVHYANLPGNNGAQMQDGEADAIARGTRIANQGLPKQGIPSCSDCHGPGDEARNPFYPNLTNQYADYIALQLHLFKSGSRGGTEYAHIMGTIAKRLTDRQIDDLASYYSSLAFETSGPIATDDRHDGNSSEPRTRTEH